MITTAVQQVLQGDQLPTSLGSTDLALTRSQKVKVAKLHGFLVKFLKLRQEHMEELFEGLDENT